MPEGNYMSRSNAASAYLFRRRKFIWIKLIDAIENQNVRDTDAAFP